MNSNIDCSLYSMVPLQGGDSIQVLYCGMHIGYFNSLGEYDTNSVGAIGDPHFFEHIGLASKLVRECK